MTFLTYDDFKKQIRDDQLLSIIQEDVTLLDATEQAAIKEAESYLSQRYQLAGVWQQSGSNRDALLVLYLADMVLYHLHSSINPRKIPALRTERYKAAIHWLSMVSDGKLSPALPQDTATADEIRWGSNPQLGHAY